MGSKKLILIVVDGFPQLSETFILNHIITLRELGYRVKVIANRKVEPPYHPLIHEYKILDDLIVRPRIPLGRINRLFVFIKYFVKSVVLDPVATFRSFNVAKYGKSAVNGGLLISLFNYLKMEKPDLIHCHFGFNGVLAEKILGVLKWRIPLYVTFHGYDTIHGNLLGTDYAALSDRVNAVFVNSQYLETKTKKLGFKEEKIKIIPVGLITPHFNDELLVEKKQFICLTVARLVEVKGIEYTLKALSLFHASNPKEIFLYSIIGDGPLRENLENLSTALGIENYVTFLGALPGDKVYEHYRRASMFILTGITTTEGEAETQGLVYQEAASNGLPLLASDAGGVKEYVIHERTGLIAEEKNVQDIFEKFSRMYFDRDLRKKLSEAAKRNAANFNQFDLTKKMIAIYESDL